MKFVALLLATAGLLGQVLAECPNACSAHGKCGAYDMCNCYRNWMSNDCSERVCQFGLAHVDTPKGDLDSSSGALSGPDTVVIVNNEVYPFGTTEQYPAGEDMSGNVLTNTAHEYRECSNKGICDRSSGTCACFEGYDGSACQRASCPSSGGGVCSGHGTCETIREIAARDGNNLYELWDAHSTMGCVCDGGYTGPDCSERICKYGFDPLYKDRGSTVRYSNWTYQFYAKSTTTATLHGNYSLVFYDATGEDWQTDPIAWDATCSEVIDALEALPNNVIPDNSVRCYKAVLSSGQDSTSGFRVITDSNMYVFSKYTLAFPQNPGKLEQIAITTYLDGTRPTLYTSETISTLGWHIYPNGFTGEDVDMVNDYCDGVTVTLSLGTNYYYLDSLDTQETKALKRCLGDSDGDSSNNVEVYDWDYGDSTNPHLIKLIDATQWYPDYDVEVDGKPENYDAMLNKYPITSLCDDSAGNSAKFGSIGGIGLCSNIDPPGFYAVVYYTGGVFHIYTRAGADYSTTTPFHVYTTKGYLQLVSADAAAFTESLDMTNNEIVDSHFSNIVHLSNTTGTYTDYDGQVDCETQTEGSNGVLDCVDKNDYLMFFTTAESAVGFAANPKYPNIYQVEKISRENKVAYPGNPQSDKQRLQIKLDYSLNSQHKWGVASPTVAKIFKFHPSTDNADNGYRYAAECSNRGICNTETGLCECFHGYTSDNCGTINALAH